MTSSQNGLAAEREAGGGGVRGPCSTFRAPRSDHHTSLLRLMSLNGRVHVDRRRQAGGVYVPAGGAAPGVLDMVSAGLPSGAVCRQHHHLELGLPEAAERLRRRVLDCLSSHLERTHHAPVLIVEHGGESQDGFSEEQKRGSERGSEGHNHCLHTRFRKAAC